MKSTILLLLFCISFGLKAQVDQSFAQRLYEEMLVNNSERPAENLYLRTAKEVYETGEDLWFYGRVLNSQTLTVSDLSQILYVELRSIDEQKPIHREMYGIENGFVNGHLFLPDSLQAGEYRLTAFTANSMMFESSPMEASRRLIVKKKIVPEILIQTTFDQEVFAAKEPIGGTVRLLTPGGEPVTETRTIISLIKDGKSLKRERSRTDSTGRLRFSLEHESTPDQLQLRVRVNDEGYEELYNQAVPFNTLEKVQLQFLPEGGGLVAAMNSQVAFKAVDRSGMPLDIQKATLFANNQPVLDFQTTHAGMGSFNLFVDSNANYTVKVSEPALDSVYVLPKAMKEGARLFVLKQSEEELRVGVMKTTGFPLDSAWLVVKQRGLMRFLAAAKIDDSGQLFKVSTKQLLTGVAELVLYNKEREPLASRLVYVKHNERLKLSVTHDSDNYAVKDEISLKIKVVDEHGTPVQTALSLALNDEMYASPFAEKNLLSHYFLDSELKGRLYEPAYYFDQPDATKRKHLDLLLMCQGWRSYEWNQRRLELLAKEEKLGLLDFVMGQLDRKSLPGRYRKQPQVPMQLISSNGAAQFSTDSIGRFPIVANYLAVSAGSNVILKVLDYENARMTFTSAFDGADAILAGHNLDYGIKPSLVKGRNWNKLPQSQAAAKEVMGVTVVDQKSSYGGFNGQNGVYKGNNSDYVCSYNILNCRNHRFGSKPMPGIIYRLGGRYVVYESGEPEVYTNTFKAFYKGPKFYQPEYDIKPEEKLIPDFRNTLTWEPLIITDENGEATVKFFASDIRSVFNGWVEGIGGNGQFGLAKFTVNVLK